MWLIQAYAHASLNGNQMLTKGIEFFVMDKLYAYFVVMDKLIWSDG